MGFVVKSNTEDQAFRLADVLTVVLIMLLGLGLVEFVSVSSTPLTKTVQVSTKMADIPKYALLSFTRSLISLVLSLSFAIFYASVAARSRRAERVLIPVLDVLQSLPVLVFLAPAVLTLIALFRDTRWGLEFACIFLIFTGQVWNLVFAYYEAQKNAPREMHEVARLVRLTALQEFFYVRFPSGIRPLIYNGMLSMAGGWFFLATCEAFTLGERSFLLPGLGSYLSLTFQAQKYLNFVVGILAMFSMILLTDIIIWRPLIVWSSRFRDIGDDSREEDSFFFDVFRKTRVPQFLFAWGRRLSSVLLKPAPRLSMRTNYEQLLKAGVEIQEFLHLRRRPSRKFTKRFLALPWGRWGVSFLLAVFLINVIPLMPSMGNALVTLSSEDWLALSHALFLSAIKVILSLFLASLWTIPFGIWVGQRQHISKYALPISQNIAAFPAPIFFPLIAMFIVQQKVPNGFVATLLMTMGTQWYILFNVLSGARMVPRDLKMVSKAFKMSVWQKFRKLYFPVLLPSLTTGWRTAVGGAWNITIVAEIVSYPGGVVVSEGIGAEITRSTEMGDYPRLVASIIVLVVGVVVLNRLAWRPINAYLDRLYQ